MIVCTSGELNLAGGSMHPNPDGNRRVPAADVDTATAYMLPWAVVPRIVMDTNVFVAALLSATGSNRAAVRACLMGRAMPLMGAALFAEHEGLLDRADLMKGCVISAAERRSLFEAYLSVCSWVKIYFLWRPNLPDEADNHLLELALAGHARAVVTNNLCDLQRGELSFPELRILTPTEFLKTLP
jgi:predicted nucleic acid-binding protein